MIIIALTLLVLFRLESLIFTIPFLNSAVKTDEKGTHYNTLIANKKDAATSLFSVSFDDKGVLTVKNTNGVFVTGTVYKGTAEFQGAASNNANYPLAIYKKA